MDTQLLYQLKSVRVHTEKAEQKSGLLYATCFILTLYFCTFWLRSIPNVEL